MEEQRILTDAIRAYNPRQIVILFSGGYDSMVTAHLTRGLDTEGIPVGTWAIDTKLSADGWLEYVAGVAVELALPDFHIYDNQSGYEEFEKWVSAQGCPRSKLGHNRAYNRLKNRAIAAIHMLYKQGWRDKTLFVTGIRRSESVARKDWPEHGKNDKSNICYCCPILHWSDERVTGYRIQHDLPANPFYDTVKGSGDCQCNWGNFIKLARLQKFSPKLAAGNVAQLDRLSRERHGYGWDEEPPPDWMKYQATLFPEELDGVFLCSNCSRGGDKHKKAEEVYLQRHGV